MKTIRRLEDFNGLENGKGLKIKAVHDYHVGEIVVRVFFEDRQIYGFYKENNINKHIKVLKSLGFEAEWKPKRTLEEVLNDYKEIDFVAGQNNWTILEDTINGEFFVMTHCKLKTFGAKYYCEETAKKICEELNS